MKFLHTGDLHIGKKLFEASVLEDQAYILDQIYSIALKEQVQAVVLAGDLYDRSVPPAEAVTLMDDFLTRLVQAGIPVIAISGNHDSPERISFGDKILEKQGLYMA
ncbi:MAG: exonuclease subunit SbcD, partial [Acetatifactor sp.]|nr:exonuclease subunit SbcD [Acetatifactor sp.]